jgi:hypothetical protein
MGLTHGSSEAVVNNSLFFVWLALDPWPCKIDQLILLQLKGGDKGSRSRLRARIISLQLTETRTAWP